MNDQQLDHKVHQDAVRVKKDFDILMEDSLARLDRFENHVSQAAKDLTGRVENGISQLSKDYEKLARTARKTMADASETVKKDVGRQLIHFNGKARKRIVPKGFAQKAARYSWVVLPLALVVGFMLGNTAHSRFQNSAAEGPGWMMQ